MGTIVIDETDGDLFNGDNTYSVQPYSKVGGSTSNGAYSNLSITDSGDGYGHTASLSGDSDSRTVLSGDYTIGANNAGPDTFKLTFGITFLHNSNAESGNLDARARSRLEVERTSDLFEYLYSELESETGKDYHDSGKPTWQDRVSDESTTSSGGYQGTWGDNLLFGETRYFDVVLAAGESIDLAGEFVIDGEIFEDGASYTMTSEMFVFLDSTMNLTNPVDVPEPSSLALITACGLIAGSRRRRR